MARQLFRTNRRSTRFSWQDADSFVRIKAQIMLSKVDHSSLQQPAKMESRRMEHPAWHKVIVPDVHHCSKLMRLTHNLFGVHALPLETRARTTNRHSRFESPEQKHKQNPHSGYVIKQASSNPPKRGGQICSDQVLLFGGYEGC